MDDNIGNLLIKHKFNSQIFYLCNDLNFTTKREIASKFYLLKSGDTSILNNDRININSGNKTLLITSDNNIKFMDRSNMKYDISTCIITTGSDNVLPITYETALFFLTDKLNNLALKFSPITNQEFNSDVSINENPKLLNSKFDITTDINDLQFYLEKYDDPIINIPQNKTSNFSFLKKNLEFNENNRSILLLILLFIILFLCSMLNR